MTSDPYHKHVEQLEAQLAPYAKRSFESFSGTFVDGTEILSHYETQWNKEQTRIKLSKRTPLQIERDRILYSEGMRKLTEKYHVIYNGQKRIVRNYITHTMRMAQVTRAICRGLQLNGDFAEAIALGSKIGALPFIHASKEPVSAWVKQKIKEIDEKAAKNDPLVKRTKEQLVLGFNNSSLPPWVERLQSNFVLERVKKYIPWAAGDSVDHGYSSGQQGYWLLCTNRYHVSAKPASFCPETMYGIWRHSRGLVPEKGSFIHRCSIAGATSGELLLRWDHATYESAVVQYADDITWIIENLNDANTAALINGKPGLYPELRAILEGNCELKEHLFRALTNSDSGGIYTYFINDFVGNSINIFNTIHEAAINREGLRSGQGSGCYIGCSPEANARLNQMAFFLSARVFSEKRVENRFRMLQTLSRACIDLLYDGKDDVLSRHVEEKGVLEGWSQDQIREALELLEDPVHRIQVAINVFADMGDQEIYDFVGIQAL